MHNEKLDSVPTNATLMKNKKIFLVLVVCIMATVMSYYLGKDIGSILMK